MRPSEDICNIRSNSHFLASSLNGLLKLMVTGTIVLAEKERSASSRGSWRRFCNSRTSLASLSKK